MHLTIFAFAALASIAAAAGQWPQECLYTDGVACYRKCVAEGLPSEQQGLCYNAEPKSPYTENSYASTRVHMSLTPSSQVSPQTDPESDEFKLKERCYCFRSLSEDEISKASPVDTMAENKCQYHSIRCLRRVELGDVASCAESFFRCKEMIDGAGIDARRAATLRAELCQRFLDINESYSEAIAAVELAPVDGVFTAGVRTKKIELLEIARREFDARRKMSCEGKDKDDLAIKDPESKA